MRESAETCKGRPWEDEAELDKELARIKSLGFLAFDHEASEIGQDLMKWFDKELQKLGYEVEELGSYPVIWYRVVKL